MGEQRIAQTTGLPKDGENDFGFPGLRYKMEIEGREGEYCGRIIHSWYRYLK